MKYLLNIYILIVIVLNTCLFSQTVDPLYEVGTWQGFRTCAISYTFDDGCANQFTVAIPMFDEFGFQLTLYTVIDWSSGNWTKLQNAANSGHEIGSHTLTHPHLGAQTTDQQTRELKNSRDQIDAHIKGQKCLTIAYPYCETGTISLTKENYIGARICSGSIEPKTPSDFYQISSIICGTEGSIKTVKNFNDKANQAANLKGWLVYLIHGIDNDGGYSPVKTDTLRGSLQYLKSDTTKFWVSSFVNVVRYIKERNNVKVDEISSVDSAISVQVTDTLNNEIYNFPVTIRRQLPDNWPSAVVYQKGKSLVSHITESNSKKYVMFDVVPDSGEVIITKSTATGVRTGNITKPGRAKLMQNYPNPFNPTTNFGYRITDFGFTTLKVYDIIGNEITTLVNEVKPAGEYNISFNASNLSSGLYFYQLRSGNFVDTKKFIVMK